MRSEGKSTLDGWLLRTQATQNKTSVVPEVVVSGIKRSNHVALKEPESSRQKRFNIDEVDLLRLESDPGLRKPIFEYNPNQLDRIRREYLFTKGPCQPNQENYPLTSFGKQNRSFQKKWFSEFNWLEYSVGKDACFCLYCYLFNGCKGADCFVVDGFRNWKKKFKLRVHVGNVNSAHNKAYIMGQNLIKQNNHIDIAFVMQDNQERDDYKGRLESSIKVVRLLLEMGIPFRGHDEKDESEKRGNFLTVLRFLAENSPEVKRLQQNAPVGVSCKRKDGIRELQLEKILNGVLSGELKTGRGLYQETSLKRAADTRWGSHYDSLLRVISMFPVVIEILTIIDKDGETKESRGKANALKYTLLTYDFVFKLFVMKIVLGITNSLSKSLQRKDQDIVNAMALLKLCKERFQQLREDGWADLILQVSEHCQKNDIEILDMNDKFIGPKRPLRGEEQTNDHHYRVGLFYVIIDMQVSELEERFPELETELLFCMGSLSPAKSFSTFDKKNLLRLATLYEVDFSSVDILALGDELDMYHIDVISDNRFSELKGMTELSVMMVKTGKHLAYPLVYSLLTLALILPVSTATVERAFSAMKIIKTELRNRMGEIWMSDSLIVYIEQKIFFDIDIKKIAKRFQGLEKRRKQLPLDY